MKIVLWVIRWLIGLLFIFSGLIKVNDPQGLSYKMQEFFDVWHLQVLNDFSLPLAFLMNIFEVLAGVAVIIGWQMKRFSRLLLLLILFFTFLTGYALFSGKIKTCGCFGDCIPLTPAQSFAKDIVLLILILVLVFQHQQIKSIFSTKKARGWLLFTVFVTTAAQVYVLRYLPLVDCLPYKTGARIKELMKMPAGAVSDSFTVEFVYSKGGKQVSFDAAHFPPDFDDIQYTFIERKNVLVKKGNGLKPAIHDFTLYNIAGEDATEEVLGYPTEYTLVFIQDANDIDKWKPRIDQLYQNPYEHPKIILVCAEAERLRSIMPDKVIMGCDATVIKTAARVKPTIYFMKGDEVLRKKSLYGL